MEATRWSGGKTGLEQMPQGKISLSYIEVWKEVPHLYLEDQENPAKPPPGYFDPEFSGTNLHATSLPFRINSLSVWINGIQVPASRIDPSTFSITSSMAGYVRVSYLPADSDIYYSNNIPAEYQYTPFRVRLCPAKKVHIDEIMAAMDNLATIMTTPKVRFSVGPGTGFPMRSTAVASTTPILSQLFDEIDRYLIYLHEFAVSLGAGIIIPTPTRYTSRYVLSSRIEQIRGTINNIEAALTSIGL